MKPFSLAFLERSFKEHLYWYASDRSFTGVGPRHVSLVASGEISLAMRS